MAFPELQNRLHQFNSGRGLQSNPELGQRTRMADRRRQRKSGFARALKFRSSQPAVHRRICPGSIEASIDRRGTVDRDATFSLRLTVGPFTD